MNWGLVQALVVGACAVILRVTIGESIREVWVERMARKKAAKKAKEAETKRQFEEDYCI